ncbi:integrase [Methylobacterium radiotolerans]|nr:integrase [Methylobacterium radiotolerans]
MGVPVARKFLDFGWLVVTTRYVHDFKGDGVLWYIRRIPKHAQPHHGGKAQIRRSLKTRDPKVAAVAAAKLAKADDVLWATLKGQEAPGGTTSAVREAAKHLLVALNLNPGDLGRKLEIWEDPGATLDGYFERRYGQTYTDARHGAYRDHIDVEDLWTPEEREAVRLLKEGDTILEPRLSDALEIYLRLHKRGQAPKFKADADRVFAQVYMTIGDLPLTDCRRDHAHKLVEAMLSRGNKTQTVRRNLNTVVAVFNRGLKEFDVHGRNNPFEGIQIAQEHLDTKERLPYTAEELRKVAEACRKKDDTPRHIIALQADTGARLAEIAGLLRSDVVLDGPVPHIIIQPHPKLGRTLKTPNSERKIPLVGEALWAAQRALAAPLKRDMTPSVWLFPRYLRDGELKAVYAGNTINKWLKTLLKNDKTSHSFRHAMRDRLRHAKVPKEIQDIIGGWEERSVGQGYGEGYSLEQLHEYMLKVAPKPPQAALMPGA